MNIRFSLFIFYVMGQEILKWLEAWYRKQCDGDWEHEYGIEIKNIDNPGWMVVIDLIGTEEENLTMEKISIDNGDNDWYFIEVKEKKFHGVGDPDKLYTILETFKNIVEKS